eukprot:8466284-Pyramimonas_sp.AAC.1
MQALLTLLATGIDAAMPPPSLALLALQPTGATLPRLPPGRLSHTANHELWRAYLRMGPHTFTETPE